MICTFAVHFSIVPLPEAPKAPQLRRVPGPVGLGATATMVPGWVGGMMPGEGTWMDGKWMNMMRICMFCVENQTC